MKLSHLIRPCPLAASLLLAFSGLLTLGADYASTVLNFVPLAYWRFNETAASPPLNKVANSGSVADADGYFVLDAILGQTGANAIVGNAVRLNNGGSALGYCGSKIDVPFTPGLKKGHTRFRRDPDFAGPPGGRRRPARSRIPVRLELMQRPLMPFARPQEVRHPCAELIDGLLLRPHLFL